MPKSNAAVDYNEDSDSSIEGDKKFSSMIFDRSLVGDRNGLKTAIIKSVYENQIHLQARKGEAFDALAAKLNALENFKPYHLHGRKLQKSFNKIARDIKDCIVAGNEPSRWGKEEPEFFSIARKIFDEARCAGIRAFDEKLKSKAIEDRILDEEEGKRKKKRDLNSISAPEELADKQSRFDEPNLFKLMDEYLQTKMQEIQSNIGSGAPTVKLTKTELEAGLAQAVEKFSASNIKTIAELLNAAGISETGKLTIKQNCGFSNNDDVMIFLLTYSEAVGKSGHPISNIREQFNNITARDASVLYNYIGRATK